MKRIVLVLLLIATPVMASELIGDWTLAGDRAYTISGNDSIALGCVADRPAVLLVTGAIFPRLDPPFTNVEWNTNEGPISSSLWYQIDNLTDFYSADPKVLKAISTGTSFSFKVAGHSASFKTGGARMAIARVTARCGGAPL